MPGLPVAVTGDMTDIPGLPGSVGFPNNVFASITTTVLAEGRPVCTLGAIAAPHGNYTDPKRPGFNPPCASSAIATKTIPNILVEGKPIAVVGVGVGSLTKCGHWVLGPGALTVIAGL